MPQLRTIDLTQQVPTTGIPICNANSRRVWMAFTNEGPNIIDLTWIDPRDGATIVGRIRLQAGQGAWFDRNSMFWDGALSAVSYVATTTLAGVECEEWA